MFRVLILSFLSITEHIHIQLSVLCTFRKGMLKEVGNMCDKSVNIL